MQTSFAAGRVLVFCGRIASLQVKISELKIMKSTVLVVPFVATYIIYIYIYL